MGRHQKTLDAIFQEPVRPDIQWRAVEALLVALGAELTEGRGSRVRVVLNGTRAVFHRPHPKKELSRLMVRSLPEFLTSARVR